MTRLRDPSRLGQRLILWVAWNNWVPESCHVLETFEVSKGGQDMVTTRNPRLILAAILMMAAPAAHAQLGLVSQSQELQAGREADAQITQQYRISRDSNYNNQLRSLGTRLTRVSERPDLPWTFRVLD